MTHQKYMFDTNVFNALLDGSFNVDVLKPIYSDILVTHIQRDEIKKTRNDERRLALLQIFQDIIGEQDKSVSTTSFVLGVSKLGKANLGGEKIIDTESMVWGVSNWDEAKWTAEDNLYSAMKEELDKLNKRKSNNIQDALIAETALKNSHVLVTRDNDLFRVATKFGCAVMSMDALLAQLRC